MQAYDPSAGYPPKAPNPNVTPMPDAADRILGYQATDKPWFLSIIDNLRELAAQKRQPPLQVSFRPMTEDELRDNDDPALRQLAHFSEEKSFFKSLRENLKEVFNPTKLPPLELTSRPLTKEEMSGQGSLAHLEQTSLPWYRTILGGFKDLLFPEKLPPLQVTSQPVQVRELFQKDPYRGGSFALSLVLQFSFVGLLLLVGTSKTVQNSLKNAMPVFAPNLEPYTPPMATKKQAMGGGGGGGDRSPLPASKGRLPRASLKQFTPPVAVLNNLNPKLTMEPTILIPPDVPLPNVNMAQYGDPFSKFGTPSNSTGSGGGIGSGSGGGVGSGESVVGVAAPLEVNFRLL